jgi:hypothetical protein
MNERIYTPYDLKNAADTIHWELTISAILLGAGNFANGTQQGFVSVGGLVTKFWCQRNRDVCLHDK